MLRKSIFTLILLVASVLVSSARERASFNDSWLFRIGDDPAMSGSEYNDSGWRKLSLPHDWAIEGNFSMHNPSGYNTGALPSGIGWYRKHFRVPASLAADDKLFITFDGVYMNSTVYINGHELGTRPYGYISFQYDLTPYLRRNDDNVIAVRVDNSDQPTSRWYSGCGIYRNVWLVKTAPLHIGQWGTHVVTDAKKGTVTVDVTLVDEQHSGAHPMVRNTLLDADGRVVAQSESGRVTQQLRVRHPKLWSVEQPYIYKVRTEVILNNKKIDEVTTTTAFRYFRFDPKTGFWLNGKNMKINGVCDHHDMGCLGAALNTDALHRQLVKLKQMGANAIRCSHNPPAPELLDMCDTMGLLVMDEAFDMWHIRKTANDYARFFDKWHKRDLTDMLLRDRNHPSIIIWSIGNEVREQLPSLNSQGMTDAQASQLLAADDGNAAAGKDVSNMPASSKLAIHLVNIVKSLDTSRPVTAGCDYVSTNDTNQLLNSGAIDLVGYNYHRKNLKEVPSKYPGKPLVMTESVSSLMTRGYYRMPSDSMYIAPPESPEDGAALMCSSYDNSHVPWGSSHEETWDIVKHMPYCSGQFIWTGWDYIGEPTPYSFPARSSYFGIIDLAGFPKDIYYMYQSEWSSKPVLHLFPHWNWLRGQDVDMWCYYSDADEVELFVNGKSCGTRRKADSHQYHVAWRVKYEPGEVTVVARKGGAEVRRQTIRTAGAPEQIRLECDYRGESTIFVNAEVTDKDGNLCPNAENRIYFTAENADIIGVDNGSQFSMERFKSSNRKAFFGKCMVVVKVKDKSKPVSVHAQASDLSEGSITIR